VHGINYYRLTQVDADGRLRLSNVVTINYGISSTKTLRIYPNPVGNSMLLSFQTNLTNNVGQVLAADGKLLFQAKGTITQINLELNRRINKLKPGMYIFKVSNSLDQQSVQFIKD
jgi:hypothetical protein